MVSPLKETSSVIYEHNWNQATKDSNKSQVATLKSACQKPDQGFLFFGCWSSAHSQAGASIAIYRPGNPCSEKLSKTPNKDQSEALPWTF